MKRVIFFLLVFFNIKTVMGASLLVELLDPSGDDNGPGTYIYPTDPVYKKGSFDIMYMKVEEKEKDVIFRVRVGTKIKDPWDSKSWPGGGNGFSLQMVFIFIDTDHKEGKGQKEGVAGLNVQFQKESWWEKCVIISPQPKSRLRSEIKLKAANLQKYLIIPRRTYARGKELFAVVSKKELGQPSKGWGYQVVMQSNEGYPGRKDLLTRRVNEYNGQHRFGGGTDYDCDPHVIDIVVAPAKGTSEEVKTQHRILSGYKCAESSENHRLVELPMVYP